MPNVFVGRIQSSAPTSAAVGGASTTVVAENSQRIGLILTNLSTGTMYLGFGTNAAVIGSGIVLLPSGGSWSMDDYTYTKEAIQAIAHSANSNLAIQEFIDRS